MNALADAKSKIEENEELKSKFQEMTNREKNGYFDKEKKSVEIGKTQEGKVADDSLVIAVTDDAQTNTPLEIVKLPKTTDKSKVSEETSFAEYEENSDLNSQNNDSNDEPTIADLNESENDDTKSSEESEGQKPQSSHQDLLNIVNTSMETNNSILSEFVQSILKTKYRKKFDPQDLRDKIKNNSYYRNQTWNTNYELLMCKSQPYLQRMSALGEYF